MKIAVSIINYRTADLTIACVESVLADIAFSGVATEIVVVDNASGDGSDQVLQAWVDAHPDAPVKLVLSPTNTGFSGGHNQGITNSTADYVLVLNSDAALRPGCLATLAAAGDANPKAGLIAPRLEDEDGTVQNSCFRFARPASEMIRGANSGPVTRLLKRWDTHLGTHPDPARIEWASFACILLRRSMIDQLGLMDEGYFLYFEDVEYTRRATKAGWTVLYEPAAACIHHRGGSGPVKSLQSERKRLPPYLYASRARYFYQFGGWPGLWGANLLFNLGHAIGGLRALTGRDLRGTAKNEAADVWTNALKPLGPRRAPGEDTRGSA